MDELKKRFEEAGTTFECRPDGRVAVTNWPKPRTSNRSFLRDLVAEWEAAERAKLPKQ